MSRIGLAFRAFFAALGDQAKAEQIRAVVEGAALPKIDSEAKSHPVKPRAEEVIPGRSEAISQCFALARMVPTAQELERARAAMSGRNRALLDTVAKAVREDLLRVKEGLDIFLRREDRQPQQLSLQVLRESITIDQRLRP